MNTSKFCFFVSFFGVVSCLNQWCPDNINGTLPARPEAEIFGGRSVKHCDATCLERKTYQLICYSDLTWQYDLWWWITTFITTGNISWVFYCLTLIIALDLPKKRYKLDLFTFSTITSAFALGALVSTILFLLATYNGITYDALIGGVVFFGLTLQMIACFTLGCVLLITLVWRRILDASLKMMAVGKVNYLFTLGYVASLFLVSAPICILSELGLVPNGLYFIPLLFQGVTGIILSALGVKYTCKLGNLMKKSNMNISNENQILRSFLKSVKDSVIMLMICMAVLVVAMGVGFSGTFSSPEYLLWGFRAPIFVGVNAIVAIVAIVANSVSYKARKAVVKKRLSKPDNPSNNSNGYQKSYRSSVRRPTNVLLAKQPLPTHAVEISSGDVAAAANGNMTSIPI